MKRKANVETYVDRALADMDSDGRLGSEEFVLAMHLCDVAKAGEQIPTALPSELVPPTFRRQRQSSLTLSQNAPENVDPLAGMPQVCVCARVYGQLIGINFLGEGNVQHIVRTHLFTDFIRGQAKGEF